VFWKYNQKCLYKQKSLYFAVRSTVSRGGTQGPDPIRPGPI
jgi:hypothetical protein